MKQHLKVLVVDDDANLRKTLSDILRIKGYEVVAAGTGAEAIAEAGRAFVNVALIDLKLPDMSGIEVMVQIRHATPLTEAIILTGHAALETAVEATNKGAFSYLMKPYEIDDLLLHIRKAVERQQSQQEILRLASFPRLNPDAVIELDASGKITYLNPAAERRFPDLASLGMKHPMLDGLQDKFAAFLKGEQGEIVREVTAGEAVYEQRAYFVPESNLIRITALDISERRGHVAKIEKLNQLLLVLRDINENLLKAENEQRLFQQVCESLKRLEDVVIMWEVSLRPELKVIPVAWSGAGEVDVAALGARWMEGGNGFVGRAIRELVPVLVREAMTEPHLAAWQDAVRQWGCRTAIAVPVYTDSEVIAALSIFSRETVEFDDELVEFLTEVARNVAIGVHALRLDKRLLATLGSLRKSLDGTVAAIARLVELRDPYTAGHERHVAKLACAIGKEMGLPERQVEGLRVIGYLHDIGKIAVPAEILTKPTALSEIEVAMVRNHAQYGHDILEGLEFPWPVAQAVLQHHERLDGTGYPLGIKGMEIILEARILMVADVVEAMANHRPYRASLGLDAALDEITANQGQRYDPDVVNACVRLFAEHGFSFEEP